MEGYCPGWVRVLEEGIDEDEGMKQFEMESCPAFENNYECSVLVPSYYSCVLGNIYFVFVRSSVPRVPLVSPVNREGAPPCPPWTVSHHWPLCSNITSLPLSMKSLV